MTENEAIKILQGAIKKPNTQDGYLGQAVTMAIQALEDAQQYRAIGTVERLKHLEEYVDTINKLCADYSAIGTVEEFKALKEVHDLYEHNNNLAYVQGRTDAIDEFAEKLKKLYQAYDIDLCLEDNAHLSYTNSCIALESYIDEIAEQLKAGGV